MLTRWPFCKKVFLVSKKELLTGKLKEKKHTPVQSLGLLFRNLVNTKGSKE